MTAQVLKEVKQYISSYISHRVKQEKFHTVKFKVVVLSAGFSIH